MLEFLLICVCIVILIITVRVWGPIVLWLAVAAAVIVAVVWLFNL